MGAELRALLKPLRTIYYDDLRGSLGGPKLGSHDADRLESLGQLYA